MHRVVSKDSEIDPMNAPTRTVFFDRIKSDKVNQYGQKSAEENTEKSISIKKQSQIFPKSLEKFTDSKISDDKIADINKKIGMYQALQMYFTISENIFNPCILHVSKHVRNTESIFIP